MPPKKTTRRSVTPGLRSSSRPRTQVQKKPKREAKDKEKRRTLSNVKKPDRKSKSAGLLDKRFKKATLKGAKTIKTNSRTKTPAPRKRETKAISKVVRKERKQVKSVSIRGRKKQLNEKKA